MKKTQTKTDKKVIKAVVELSEKELASVAGGAKKDRRIIVY
ncbi:bacteriocin [Microvirga soli]|nr:bacteriocin [Microvirga soli]